jgi:hypothetical protein
MSSIKTYPYTPSQQKANSTQYNIYEEEIPVAFVSSSPPPAIAHTKPSVVSYDRGTSVHSPNHVPIDTRKPVVSYNGGASTVQSPNYLRIDTRKPVTLSYCPNCAKSHVITTPRTKVTGTTWFGVVVGAVIFWPLCWIPLVVKPMKQTNHYCQSCGIKVGRVKPFQ